MQYRQTKTDEVRSLVKDGHYFEAMRIAKDFKLFNDPKDKDLIQTAWSAYQNPSFYKQIGKDSIKLMNDGIDTLRRVFDTTQ